MRKLLSTLLALLFLPGLAACDYFNLEALQPGVSTAAEVRKRLGPPDMQWREADGTLIWEFSRQPEGTRCYMLTIGPDDVLRRVEQVLNDGNYRRIHAGMTEAEVRRILGRPAGEQILRLSSEKVWRWHIAADPSITGRLFFTVHFDLQGRVVTTGQDVEYRGN